MPFIASISSQNGRFAFDGYLSPCFQSFFNPLDAENDGLSRVCARSAARRDILTFLGKKEMSVYSCALDGFFKMWHFVTFSSGVCPSTGNQRQHFFPSRAGARKSVMKLLIPPFPPFLLKNHDYLATKTPRHQVLFSIVNCQFSIVCVLLPSSGFRPRNSETRPVPGRDGGG